VLKDPNA
jgi:hypothetical protein